MLPEASSGTLFFPSLSRLLAFGTGHIRVALIPQWVELSVVAPGYQCRKEAWRLLNWSMWERKGVAYRLQGTRWKPRDYSWEVHMPPGCHLSARCQVGFVTAIPLCSPCLVASHGAQPQTQSELSKNLCWQVEHFY